MKNTAIKTNIHNLAVGTVINTARGTSFKVAKLNKTGVSYYVGEIVARGHGKNQHRMASQTFKMINEGIESGFFTIA